VYFHYMAWRTEKENGLSLLDEILADLVSFERQYADGRSPKNGKEPPIIEPKQIIKPTKSLAIYIKTC